VEAGDAEDVTVTGISVAGVVGVACVVSGDSGNALRTAHPLIPKNVTMNTDSVIQSLPAIKNPFLVKVSTAPRFMGVTPLAL
jgi:hypothetical protein